MKLSKQYSVLYLLIGLIGVFLCLIIANRTASALSLNIKDQISPLHSDRRACGAVSKNYVSCLADVVTNLNGSPMILPSSVVGNLGPSNFHSAYNLPCSPNGLIQSICPTPSTYGPQTIAIVDAGGFNNGGGTIDQSLDGYDANYGLPACNQTNGCFSVVNESGQTSPLPSPVSAGWIDETALDVETAHMICQNCKIILVEANTSSVADMAMAEATAAGYNPVAISNSYSSSSENTAYNSYYNYPGVAVVAATGDGGSATPSWPADLSNVVAVSGTTLSINPNNTWAGETVWSWSGGGCSTNSVPIWQSDLSNWATAGCGSNRAYGDISADADPNSGMAVYLATSSTAGSWYEFGGTSLATPLIASIFALTGGVLPGNNATSMLYGSFNATNSHDITSGDDCNSSGQLNCTAGVGFDTPSGLGSPNGISGFSVQPATNLTLKVANQIGTAVLLSWTGSENRVIGGYNIFRNGVKIATVTSGNSYTDTSLTANTSYSYYVQAYDPFGNIASPTVSQAITTYFPADINGDGHVNLIDLSILASKWGSTTNLGRADINGDGTVNLIDLSILASEYNAE